MSERIEEMKVVGKWSENSTLDLEWSTPIVVWLLDEFRESHEP